MGFGDDFLAKRYAAGREDVRAEGRSELLKFLEENPGATVEEVKEWLRNRCSRRKGEETGKKQRSSRPPFCSDDSEEVKGMGFGDAFLAKRYMVGWKEGFKESFAKNFAIGLEEGIEIRNAQLLKFLEENPGATAKEVEEWARSRDLHRNGDGDGEERRG